MLKLNPFQILLFLTLFAFSHSQTTRNRIPTRSFCPRNIYVRLRDLPKPFASESVDKNSQVVPMPSNAKLQVPNGFRVNVFAQDLNMPRWIELTPTGDILVTETPDNQIRLLRDTDGDGVADVNVIFAGPDNGLNQPFGMAFAAGFFYLGNTDAVLRFPYTDGQQNITGTGEKLLDLPTGGNHWTRNVRISPDGQKVHVTVGSAANVEEEDLPRASVTVMNLDGSDVQTFASGLRNPNGFDYHPVTKEIYVTVNERDALGDDLVPDYFTRIQEGDFFGWPYAYLSPNNIDPRMTDDNGNSLNPELAASTKTPDVLFQAHSAALGMKFYNGKTFPRKFRNGAFVAFRGSWNRNSGTGYKIVFVPFGRNNRPLGYYQNFVTGFLIDPTVPKTWGRPVGVLVAPDGSLLFTEEMNGKIFRVQYRK